MSTRVRAWMVGAAIGAGAVAYVNYKIIKPNQSDILLSLRQALLSPEIRPPDGWEVAVECKNLRDIIIAVSSGISNQWPHQITATITLIRYPNRQMGIDRQDQLAGVEIFMLGEEYLSAFSKSTPGSRRVTPSKTLPTEVKTPNSKRDKQFGGSVPRISMQTVHKVLTAEIKCSYLVIDCRYQYEYDGGHIVGAINCPPSDRDKLMEWLFVGDQAIVKKGPLVLIMHCEFSQCRAPKLASDIIRQYIACGMSTGLEVYVMKGGYSEFHRAYPQSCDPFGYTPMHDHRSSLEDQSMCSSGHFQALVDQFDPDMFAEKPCSSAFSSQGKNRRGTRRWRSSGGGTCSIPSDSPFFHHSCSSPMDFSPVGGVVADLARVFIEEVHGDDSCSGGSAASRRGVYINTEDDAEDGDYSDSDHKIFHAHHESISGSPSRSSSASSYYVPAKRRASMSAVHRMSDGGGA